MDLSHALEKYRRAVLTICLLAIAGILVAETTKLMRHPTTGDLGVYLHAAERLVTGGNIYEPDVDGRVYLYPPLTAFLCIPLAYIPRVAAIWLWCLLKVVALGWSVKLLLELITGQPFRAVARQVRTAFAVLTILLSLRFILLEMGHGQLDTFEMALALLALWLADRSRQFAAGLTLGFSALLKVMTLPFVLVLLLRKRWTSLAGTTVGIVGGIILPALVLGFTENLAAFRQWTVGYLLDPARQNSTLPLSGNVSITGQVMRFFGTEQGFVRNGTEYSLMIVQLSPGAITAIDLTLRLLIVGAILIYWWRFDRKGPSAPFRFGLPALVFATGIFLFPTTQTHYFVMQLPAFGYLAYLWLTEPRFDRAAKYLALAAFAMNTLLTQDVLKPFSGYFFENAGCLILGMIFLSAAIFRADGSVNVAD